MTQFERGWGIRERSSTGCPTQGPPAPVDGAKGTSSDDRVQRVLSGVSVQVCVYVCECDMCVERSEKFM